MSAPSQGSGGGTPGYDIGASLSGSSSAGASLSGATDAGGASYNFGTAYGPGSLLLTDYRGSTGAASSISTWPLLIAAALIAAILFFKRN